MSSNYSYFLSRTFDQWFRDFIEVETPSMADSFMAILPCFGTSLYQPAVDALPQMNKWKTFRLVRCIIDTGRDAAPVLLQLLNDPSEIVRETACWGLAEVYESDLDTPPLVAESHAELIYTLEYRETDWFENAFNKVNIAWGKAEACNPPSKEVLDALITKALDSEPAVRIVAVNALDRLGYSNHLDRCGIHIKTEQSFDCEGWKSEMDDMLPRYGEEHTLHDAHSFPALFAKLTSSSVTERYYALNAFGKLDGEDLSMELHIVPSLKDSDIAIRLAAVKALGTISSTNPVIARALLSMYQDPCKQVAANAQRSFIKKAIDISAVRCRIQLYER
jgi:hypothetical protein